jgi:hypothetical protein
MPILVRILLISATAALALQSQSLSAQKPPVSHVRDVTINAVTGLVTSSGRTFGPADRIRLVIHEVNPFLHQYQIVVDSSVIPEANPAQFVNAAQLGFTLPAESPLESMTTTSTAVERTSATCQMRDPIQDAQRRYDAELEQIRSALQVQDNWSATELKSIAAHRHALGEAALAMFNATTSADAVKAAAIALDTGHVRRLREMQSGIDELTPALETLRRRMRMLDRERGTLFVDASCIDPVLASVARDTVDLTVNISVLKTGVTSLTPALLSLRSTYTDANRFRLVTLLPSHRRPSDLSITVRRKSVVPGPVAPVNPPKNPEQPQTTVTAIATSSATATPAVATAKGAGDSEGYTTVAVVALRVGGKSRFSIGMAIANTRIRDTDYPVLVQRQAAPTDAPGDTIRRSVGQASSDVSRITPMLTLSTRLWDWGPTSVNAIIGAGPRSTTEAPDLFAGVSLSAWDDRLFASIGAYGARSRQLSADYKVGDVIPQSVSAIPTSTRSIVRPVFAIGFRVFPLTAFR